MSAILEVNDLGRAYPSGGKQLEVLKGVSFAVEPGSSIAIVGPSGSGKTTLLGLCAGLDHPSTGTVRLNGQLLNELNEDQRARLRNQYVGFLFQNFQLIPTLTALENVMLPMELLGQKGARNTSMELLEKVGLGDRTHHYPKQLSGGEQQRVGLARAFSNQPLILFADEPTGNLDEETGLMVEKMLFDLNKERGTTLVLVTHDTELAEKTQRVIRLKGGSVFSDSKTALAQ